LMRYRTASPRVRTSAQEGSRRRRRGPSRRLETI
jgi:hypothetical protein